MVERPFMHSRKKDEPAMWEKLRVVATIFIAGSLTGCATAVTKSQGAWGDKYSGAKCSGAITVLMANPPNHNRVAWVVVPFAAIDAVLSAVVDTIVLPVDLLVGKPKTAKGSCVSLDL